jgi:hypothetical protein
MDNLTLNKPARKKREKNETRSLDYGEIYPSVSFKVSRDNERTTKRKPLKRQKIRVAKKLDPIGKKRKQGKTSKKRLNIVGYILFVLLWTIITVLYYFGIIRFDSRSIDGAAVSGLGFSALIIGALSFLRHIYKDGLSAFRRK